MKGDPAITAHLQTILANELTASDQYFAHGRILDDLGFTVLAERMEHESLEERSHANALIERMLFLEAKPDLGQREALNVAHTVPEMLANDLAVEHAVRGLLLEGIALCEQKRDFQTREILLPLLRDTEEDHIHFLEQQCFLIEAMGLQNYLQSITGGDAT